MTTTTAAKFERIKKEIERHYNEQGKKAVQNIKKDDAYIRRYATERTVEALNAGTITKAEAIKRAIKSALKYYEKLKAQDLAKLEDAETAPDLDQIRIEIEWKRSQTWGYNPFAEVWGGGYYTTGKASGCGYDKRSAALAVAFNDNPAILKLLYIAEEKRLKKQKSARPSRRDFIGYGSAGGWSPLPYFEGGVGVSCYYRIFEACGFKFEQVADGRTFDAYRAERVKARAQK